jgi:hypothetical protein
VYRPKTRSEISRLLNKEIQKPIVFSVYTLVSTTHNSICVLLSFCSPLWRARLSEFNGGVTAEDEVKDMSHVNSDVAKELTEESQCTAEGAAALQGGALGCKSGLIDHKAKAALKVWLLFLTAEDEVKDMSHVNSDVAKELTEESQCTALNSHIGRS